MVSVKRKYTNIILVLVAIVFSLYLLEVILFVINPVFLGNIDNKRATLANKEGIKYDTRTRLEYLESKSDTSINPSIHPSILIRDQQVKNFTFQQFLPLSGIAGKLTLMCNENGKYIEFLSDEFGFNNPPNLIGLNSSEIMIIGDSFAEGCCVDQGKDTAGVLREKYHKMAINRGMGGNGPLLTLAILKEYLTFQKSKNVLWLYFEGNDLYELNAEKNVPMLKKYFNQDYSQNLPNKIPEANKLLMEYAATYLNEAKKIDLKESIPSKIMGIIKLQKIRRHLGINNLFVKCEKEAFDLDLFYKIQRDAKKFAERQGANFTFVYLPEWSTFSKNNYCESGNAYHDEIISFLKREKFNYIDFTEVLEKMDDPLKFYPFRLPGHYTEEGYELLADSIHKKIYN